MSFTVDQYDWPIRPGLKPLQHQKHTAQFCIANKRAYVLNEMGTMKTLSVLWACDILMRAGKIRRVLIIGPKSTMHSVWYNEVMMNMPTRKVGVAHGNAQIRRNVLTNAAYQFVVMNHDGIKYEEDEIVNQQFDVIIIDELTAFANNSERTKCMIRIADAQMAEKNRQRKRDGAVWGLTGDATPDSPVQAFYQCKVVNPKCEWLPRYYGQFRDACLVQINEYTWLPKAEAPQVVAMCMQPAIRYTRDQCLDLPPTTYQVMEPELTTEQKHAYDKMRKELYMEYENGSISAVNAAVKLNKLLQISAGAVKGDEGEVVEIGCGPRVDMLVDIFEQTHNRKLVVFATYRATIAMLERELTKRKIVCGSIHGDVSGPMRESLISRFQKGDLQVIILQPQSAAHGITLTAASTMVWFSLIPSNGLHEQGNARIVRGGQKHNTLIIYFLTTPAEKHYYNIINKKGDVSRETRDLFEQRMI